MSTTVTLVYLHLSILKRCVKSLRKYQGRSYKEILEMLFLYSESDVLLDSKPSSALSKLLRFRMLPGLD